MNSFRFNFLILILFRITLDYSYVNFVSAFYSYDGYAFVVNNVKYFESYVLFFLGYIILPGNIKKPSDFFLVLYFIFIVVPVLSFYSLSNQDRIALYILLSAYFIMAFVVQILSQAKIKIVFIKRGNLAVLIGMVFMSLLFLAHLVQSGATSNFNLNFARVYEYRESAMEAAFSGIWGYLGNWVTKVINIALAAWFVYKKQYKFFIITLIVQIFYFGVLSHKSIIFTFMLIPAFYYFFSKWKNPIFVLVASLTGAMLLIALSFKYTDNVFVGSILIRRLFFVPANLSFVYIDYFSANETIRLSNSILSSFISYPYEVSTAKVIGGYLGHPDMGANNGFAASGYMHFRYAGVCIFSVIVGLILYVVNTIANRLPLWLCVSVVIGPLLSLFLSSDLGVTLITHGLALSLIVLYLLSSNQSRITYRK